MIVNVINRATKNNNQEQNNNMWLPYEQFEPIDQSDQSEQLEKDIEFNQLELVFPGKSFEAPIIEEPNIISQLKEPTIFNQLKGPTMEEPHVINQLEVQQKQYEQLKQQIPISSLNNDEILMMSQEPSYNFIPYIQKLFNTSSPEQVQVQQNVNTVSQEQQNVNTVSQVQQNVNTVSQEQQNVNTVSQEQQNVNTVSQVQQNVNTVSQVQQNVNTVSQVVEDSYAGFNNEINYTNVEQNQIPVEQKASDFNYNKSIELVNPVDSIDNYSSF